MAELFKQNHGIAGGGSGAGLGGALHYIVFLLDVEALGASLTSHERQGPSDGKSMDSAANTDSGRSRVGRKAVQLAEVLTRISQVCTQLHDLKTSISYQIISSRSRFVTDKMRELKQKLASATVAVDSGRGQGGSSAGASGGTETRKPQQTAQDVLADILRLLQTLADQPTAPSSEAAIANTVWFDNVAHHVQHLTGRFVAAMQAAATQRGAGSHIQAATFVLVTSAPPPGDPVQPPDPLKPELQAALRRVNARFLWVDPSGGHEAIQRPRMEAAVAAAAAAVAAAGSGAAEVAREAAPAEEQLATLLSSHWRLEGSPADCMAPHPRLALPLLPIAWLPVWPIFTIKVSNSKDRVLRLELIVRSLAARPPPEPYAPLPPSFPMDVHPGFQQHFVQFRRWRYSWTETADLDLKDYVDGLNALTLVVLPALRVSGEPHKPASAAKATPAAAIKGAWQKRAGPPGSANPHIRPPMGPPPPVGAAGARGSAGALAARPNPLAVSAQQLNVSAGARQPLKAGLGGKPGGTAVGSRPLAGSGGVSRPTGQGTAVGGHKTHHKTAKAPSRPSTEAAAAAAGPPSSGNYTLNRAAGKRLAQALEQGTVAGAGAAAATGRPSADSQAPGVSWPVGGGAGAAGGVAAAGAAGAAAGSATGSRWVWPAMTAADVAAQAARDGGMVAVDDKLDVVELMRQADENMHDFIAGDLKSTIHTMEKSLRKRQKEEGATAQEQVQQPQQQPASQQQPREQQSASQQQPIEQQQQQMDMSPDSQSVDVKCWVSVTSAPGQQKESTAPAAAGGSGAIEEHSPKRQRVAPVPKLQPQLHDIRSRLRSKLLVAPPKLSHHEQRLPGWEPPLQLILDRAREHTRTVVDSLLRASERAVATAMRSVRRQVAERRDRLRGRDADGEDIGEQCGEVDPEVGSLTEAGIGKRKAGSGGEGAAGGDEGEVYAAAIDQVFALLQEAWASDVMDALRERGTVRGRPRLQLCALLYSASRLIYAVEMLGYRRRSPRLLVELLREQLDWAVSLLWHVEGEPAMATFVTERMRPAWADTWAVPLLDLLAISYAGDDREGINEMEFVARWDSDEDWEAGMEEAGGVEAATEILEELHRAAAAVPNQQQQGSQQGEPRQSGRSASAGRHAGGNRSAPTSAGGALTARGKQGSGSVRPGHGSGVPGSGAAGTAAAHAAGGKAGGASQPQVMEVDSLRGVVVAGAPRQGGAGRMAKHVARLDPIRPTHMMPAIIARPLIHVAPEPPPERLAAMREEHRLKQRCGGAAANLADLFERELTAPPAQPQPGSARPTAAAAAAPAAATAAAPKSRAADVPSSAAAAGAKGRGLPGPSKAAGTGTGAGSKAVAARAVQRAGGQMMGSPCGAPAASTSSTEVGPTPLDEQTGGGKYRSRLGDLHADGGGMGLARGLFTEADDVDGPRVKYNPGGEGLFGHVPTFQIVQPRAETADPARAPAAAAPIGGSQPPVAAPAGLLVLGADPAPPHAAGGDLVEDPPPAAALVDVPGPEAGAGDSPLDPALDTSPDTSPGDAAAAGKGEEALDDSPQLAGRFQAEEHSADSRGCQPIADENEEAGSDMGSEDGAFSPSAARKRHPPKQPPPDACSPSRTRETSKAGASAPVAQLRAAAGGAVGPRIAQGGGSGVGAAGGSGAASGAGALLGKRAFRSGLARAAGAAPTVQPQPPARRSAQPQQAAVPVGGRTAGRRGVGAASCAMHPRPEAPCPTQPPKATVGMAVAAEGPVADAGRSSAQEVTHNTGMEVDAPCRNVPCAPSAVVPGNAALAEHPAAAAEPPADIDMMDTDAPPVLAAAGGGGTLAQAAATAPEAVTAAAGTRHADLDLDLIAAVIAADVRVAMASAVAEANMFFGWQSQGGLAAGAARPETAAPGPAPGEAPAAAAHAAVNRGLLAGSLGASAMDVDVAVCCAPNDRDVAAVLRASGPSHDGPLPAPGHLQPSAEGLAESAPGSWLALANVAALAADAPTAATNVDRSSPARLNMPHFSSTLNHIVAHLMDKNDAPSPLRRLHPNSEYRLERPEGLPDAGPAGIADGPQLADYTLPYMEAAAAALPLLPPAAGHNTGLGQPPQPQQHALGNAAVAANVTVKSEPINGVNIQSEPVAATASKRPSASACRQNVVPTSTAQTAPGLRAIAGAPTVTVRTASKRGRGEVPYCTPQRLGTTYHQEMFQLSTAERVKLRRQNTATPGNSTASKAAAPSVSKGFSRSRVESEARRFGGGGGAASKSVTSAPYAGRTPAPAAGSKRRRPVEGEAGDAGAAGGVAAAAVAMAEADTTGVHHVASAGADSVAAGGTAAELDAEEKYNSHSVGTAATQGGGGDLVAPSTSQASKPAKRKRRNADRLELIDLPIGEEALSLAATTATAQAVTADASYGGMQAPVEQFDMAAAAGGGLGVEEQVVVKREQSGQGLGRQQPSVQQTQTTQNIAAAPGATARPPLPVDGAATVTRTTVPDASGSPRRSRGKDSKRSKGEKSKSKSKDRKKSKSKSKDKKREHRKHKSTAESAPSPDGMEPAAQPATAQPQPPQHEEPRAQAAALSAQAAPLAGSSHVAAATVQAAGPQVQQGRARPSASQVTIASPPLHRRAQLRDDGCSGYRAGSGNLLPAAAGVEQGVSRPAAGQVPAGKITVQAPQPVQDDAAAARHHGQTKARGADAGMSHPGVESAQLQQQYRQPSQQPSQRQALGEPSEAGTPAASGQLRRIRRQAVQPTGSQGLGAAGCSTHTPGSRHTRSQVGPAPSVSCVTTRTTRTRQVNAAEATPSTKPPLGAKRTVGGRDEVDEALWEHVSKRTRK